MAEENENKGTQETTEVKKIKKLNISRSAFVADARRTIKSEENPSIEPWINLFRSIDPQTSYAGGEDTIKLDTDAIDEHINNIKSSRMPKLAATLESEWLINTLGLNSEIKNQFRDAVKLADTGVFNSFLISLLQDLQKHAELVEYVEENTYSENDDDEDEAEEELGGQDIAEPLNLNETTQSILSEDVPSFFDDSDPADDLGKALFSAGYRTPAQQKYYSAEEGGRELSKDERDNALQLGKIVYTRSSGKMIPIVQNDDGKIFAGFEISEARPRNPESVEIPPINGIWNKILGLFNVENDATRPAIQAKRRRAEIKEQNKQLKAVKDKTAGDTDFADLRGFKLAMRNKIIAASAAKGLDDEANDIKFYEAGDEKKRLTIAEAYARMKEGHRVYARSLAPFEFKEEPGRGIIAELVTEKVNDPAAAQLAENEPEAAVEAKIEAKAEAEPVDVDSKLNIDELIKKEENKGKAYVDGIKAEINKAVVKYKGDITKLTYHPASDFKRETEMSLERALYLSGEGRVVYALFDDPSGKVDKHNNPKKLFIPFTTKGPGGPLLTMNEAMDYIRETNPIDMDTMDKLVDEVIAYHQELSNAAVGLKYLPLGNSDDMTYRTMMKRAYLNIMSSEKKEEPSKNIFTGRYSKITPDDREVDKKMNSISAVEDGFLSDKKLEDWIKDNIAEKKENHDNFIHHYKKVHSSASFQEIEALKNLTPAQIRSGVERNREKIMTEGKKYLAEDLKAVEEELPVRHANAWKVITDYSKIMKDQTLQKIEKFEPDPNMTKEQLKAAKAEYDDKVKANNKIIEAREKVVYAFAELSVCRNLESHLPYTVKDGALKSNENSSVSYSKADVILTRSSCAGNGFDDAVRANEDVESFKELKNEFVNAKSVENTYFADLVTKFSAMAPRSEEAAAAENALIDDIAIKDLNINRKRYGLAPVK